MRSIFSVLVLALALALALPLASAGTADAPEISDPPGDAECFGPAGNKWSDIDAAWISGETADAFDVNIRLADWVDEHLATVTGFTVQFTHQGKQFGVAAIFIPFPMGDGWYFENGYIDMETGELSDFSDSTGTFTPGPPAFLTINFAKAHFPHVDANDTSLVDFKGGSADLKNQAASFFLPVPAQPFQICDRIESDAVYEFQVGGHTMHSAAPADEGVEAGGESTDAAAEAVTPANASPAPERDTPAAGVSLVAVAAVAAVAMLRRRS